MLKVDKSAEDMVKRALFEEEYEINGKKDVQGKAGFLFFCVGLLHPWNETFVLGNIMDVV